MQANGSRSKTALRLSYWKAARVSLGSVVSSLLLAGVAFAFIIKPEPEILQEIFVSTVLMCTLIPIFVSFPVALILQRERLRVQNALHDLEEAHAELALVARTDSLTCLPNRGGFLADVQALRAQGVSGSMLMLDVDHFKAINDTYGHDAGDLALQKIADAIRTSVRDKDIVGRLGGEEFGVFVADDSIELGLLTAERIRLAVSQIDFRPTPGIVKQLTASAGVAPAHHVEDLSTILQLADRSMYEAKESGRNRVRVYEAA